MTMRKFSGLALLLVAQVYSQGDYYPSIYDHKRYSKNIKPDFNSDKMKTHYLEQIQDAENRSSCEKDKTNLLAINATLHSVQLEDIKEEAKKRFRSKGRRYTGIPFKSIPDLSYETIANYYNQKVCSILKFHKSKYELKDCERHRKVVELETKKFELEQLKRDIENLKKEVARQQVALDEQQIQLDTADTMINNHNPTDLENRNTISLTDPAFDPSNEVITSPSFTDVWSKRESAGPWPNCLYWTIIKNVLNIDEAIEKCEQLHFQATLAKVSKTSKPAELVDFKEFISKDDFYHSGKYFVESDKTRLSNKEFCNSWDENIQNFKKIKCDQFSYYEEYYGGVGIDGDWGYVDEYNENFMVNAVCELRC